jgi:hypothetical protein
MNSPPLVSPGTVAIVFSLAEVHEIRARRPAVATLKEGFVDGMPYQ